MGSLCCVAARPHEPHASRRQWSIGPRDSYYQMHTTFSPPLARKWEYILPREILPHDGDSLDDSDHSSNIEETRSWVGDEPFPGDPFSLSDQSFSGVASPASSGERMSNVPPLQLSDAAMFQNEGSLGSSSSSLDSTDFTEFFFRESSNDRGGVHDSLKCALCTKCLSKRSPWSSWRIVKNGNMPAAAILSCHHVFHVECLEQIVPEAEENDPSCPLCSGEGDESMPNQKLVSKFKNVLPWIRKEGTPKSESQNGWVRL